MRHFTRIAVSTFLVAITVMFAAGPAPACFMRAPLDFRDIALADIVVMGEIRKYHVVEDQEARQSWQEYVETLPPADKAFFGQPRGFLSDYARFQVTIETVLKGDVEALQDTILEATWDNSTFREPETLPPGSYLIALRNTRSPIPPLRGPGATFFPSPEPDLLTVLQAPCAPAFLFGTWTREAKETFKLMTGEVLPTE